MKTVVVGVTSGIAAYKTLDLIKLLKKEKLDVVVVMTKSATKMVPQKELEKVSDNKVYVELFEDRFDYKKVLKTRSVDHINLADSADVIVVAPATANIIAKIAHGIADDFLTTMLLATKALVIVCPSMNVHMYENPVVIENIEKLRLRGFIVLDPDDGDLACGYRGKGRLPVVDVIKDEVVRIVNKRTSLKDKKIIVTAGGTTEKIDDVRFVTNKSSGKMGAAIAGELFLQGAKVLLLRAKSAVKPRYQIPEKTFETAEELFNLIKEHADQYNSIFHIAAVSDFNLNTPLRGKISSKKELSLVFKPAKKIITQIKKINPRIKLIGFKATWGFSDKEMIQEAKQKIKETNADFIVVNDVKKSDRGFMADTNEVIVVGKNGLVKKLPLQLKREIAMEIIAAVFVH